MYIEGDSPHQAVMIVCQCILFSHISNFYNIIHLCTLAMFHTQHAYTLLLLIHVQAQCDLAITGDTCVNMCSLNCFNLFLKRKIGQTCCVCVCVCVCVFLDLCMLCIYVERYFESLICCLEVCLSSLLVAFISMCFSSHEKPSFFKLDSFSTNP